ncbi:MAG: FtsW/RodA/SpoVE family cell cycle protein, partial [Alphaproteobacteria bacterium]
MIAPARTDRSLFSEWWWTIDRGVLATVLGLVFAGSVLSFAAGPPMAQRLGYDTFHFVIRHAVFVGPAIVTVMMVSMLPIRTVRHIAFVVLAAALLGMVLTMVLGTEVNGARRWLRLGGFGLQPSEFMKPALIVTAAWLFSRPRTPAARRPGLGHMGVKPGGGYAAQLNRAARNHHKQQPVFAQP